MSKIAIIYGSSSGVTENVAEEIRDELGLDTDLLDIASVGIDVFDKYNKMIIGTSTWGEGELQDDWDDIFDEYTGVEFGGKTVAFFGTGDQEGYGDNFVDAMGTLQNIAMANGAIVVGDNWSAEGYDFEESTAFNKESNSFIGLVIDEDNQDNLTSERIKKWVEIIKPHFE